MKYIQYRSYWLFVPIILGLWNVSTGCERYKIKQERLERRMDYMKTLVDSARVTQEQHNDSLRHANDSLRSADTLKK